MFPFGRLLVLNFSLVLPAIFDPLLHICICFPSKLMMMMMMMMMMMNKMAAKVA